MCDVGEVEHDDASGAGERRGCGGSNDEHDRENASTGSVVGAGEYQTRCWQMRARLLVVGALKSKE